ncbi:MAG: endonuclease, partial [Actinomycetota bacterium]|nr:endonuclease [Actinomycetota bacterium]
MPVTRDAPAEERIKPLLARLKKAYPGAKVALDFTNPLECVVATILSAQSTDARVNLVTKTLFQKYRSPEDYLKVPEEELQRDIQSTGFFRQKTRSLRGMSSRLLEAYGGEVPSRMADLITLPGVARKTANIVQTNCFPEEAKKDPDAGIAVDTHVGRVAVRLGLTDRSSKEAEKIEADLKALVPRKDWRVVPDLFITHGRTICDAKRPLCEDCPVEDLCPSSQVAGLPDRYRMSKKPAPKRRS